MKRMLFCVALFPLYSFAQSVSDAIDLGLSVKWATHNIGANQKEQTGSLYAWGETSTKKEYTTNNYKYKDGDSGWTLDIGKEISATEYDVAKLLWKGEWRMPTQKEMLELCKKCEWKWTRKNDVYGYEIKGPNGNTIFLPTGKDKEGRYWSGTLSQGLGRTAIELHLTEERFFTFGTYKTDGLMIRPVMTNKDYVETIDVPQEWRDDKYSNLLSYIQNEEYEQAFVEASILAGMGELRRAHERVENASRGGCSDWDGGGNPHRMMEDMEREFAWKDFCDLCASHGLEAYQVREELSK